MTEQLRDEGFFELTDIDTSDSDWQIKSLSDNGLRGFIVGANQRMGIINHERVKQAVQDAQTSNEIDVRVSSQPLIGFLESSLYRIGFASANKEEKEAERLQRLDRNTVALWLLVNKHRKPELEIGTCESYISASTSFRWEKDQDSLSQLSKDLQVIWVAYKEMYIRGIS